MRAANGLRDAANPDIAGPQVHNHDASERSDASLDRRRLLQIPARRVSGCRAMIQSPSFSSQDAGSFYVSLVHQSLREIMQQRRRAHDWPILTRVREVGYFIGQAWTMRSLAC